MSLSFHLGKAPSMLEGEKLSLVGSDIYFIDPIPVKITKYIKTLYLSNNYISSLENIEQFEHLTIGSFTNNFIRYLDQLQPLSRLPYLQKLSLSGNLVTKMPYYKDHILALCPNLISLDGTRITSMDRSKSKLIFFKAKAFYDQLRLNELRNSALVHISKQLACHLELHQKVFGKFSNILGTHIGRNSSELSDLRYIEVGAGKILQQALRGGVYRWLQQMASKHFNHLVQDNLYKLLVRHLKKNPCGSDDGNNAMVWNSLVAEYLKEQQEYFLDLVEYCDFLSRCVNDIKSRKLDRSNVNKEGVQQSLVEALDNEVLMDGMGQLQFLSTASEHYNDNNDIHDTSRIESCGLKSNTTPAHNISNKKDLPSNVQLRGHNKNKHDTKTINQNKENIVNQQHYLAPDNINVGIVYQTKSDIFNEAYENRLNVANHNEEVHQKYAELLNHLDRPTISSKKKEKNTEHRGLSNLLPPQQYEPDNKLDGKEVAIIQPLHHQSNMYSVVIGSDEFINTATTEEMSNTILVTQETSNDNIEELITRSLLYRNENCDQVLLNTALQSSVDQITSRWKTICESIEKYIDTNHLKEIMSRYSTKNQQPLNIQPITDPALSTMSALKSHIQLLSNRFILSQREEYALFEFHEHFKSTISSFEKQVLSVVDDAVRIYGLKSDEFAECKQDIMYISVWLEIHREVVVKLETIQSEVAKICQQQNHLELNIDIIQAKIQEQLVIRHNLENSLHEVELALDVVTKEIEKSSTISSLVKYKRIQELDSGISKILASIKRKIFKLFRQRVSQQIKVKLFYHHVQSRHRNLNLRFFYNYWLYYVQTIKISHRLMRMSQRRMKLAYLMLWKQTFMFNHWVISKAHTKISSMKMKRVLVLLRNQCKIQVKNRNMSIRNNLYVAIYSSIRIFRAWKGLIYRSICDNQSKIASINLCRIKNIWITWRKMLCIKSNKDRCLFDIVSVQYCKSLKKRFFLDWITYYQFKTFLYNYRYQKRYFLIFKKRLMLQKQYRKKHKAFVFQLKSGLSYSFELWRRKTIHQRHITATAKKLRLYYDKSIATKAIKAWKSVSSNFYALSQKYFATSLYRNINILQKHFNKWKCLSKRNVYNQSLFIQPQNSMIKSTSQQEDNNNNNEILLAETTNKLHHSSVVTVNILHTTSSSSGKNKIRSSMSNLDFLLLYLDDSSSDEENFNIEGSKDISNQENMASLIKSYCVLVRKYLRRWFQCLMKAKLLVGKISKVKELMSCTVQQRYFSKLFEVWISSLSLKRTKYHEYLQLQPQPDNNSEGNQEEYLSARLRVLSIDNLTNGNKRIELQQSIDNLAVDLAKAREDVHFNNVILQDVSTSVDVLNSEHEHFLVRINETTSYISKFQLIQERINKSSSSSWSILDKATCPSAASYHQPQQTVDNSTNDEKILLMRDVESLYRNAVTAQESMIKKKLVLGDETEARWHEVALKKDELAHIHLQVNKLRLQRKELENALENCNLELEKAFAHILMKTSKHEELLDELYREENELRNQLETFSREEKRLTLILETTTTSAVANNSSVINNSKKQQQKNSIESSFLAQMETSAIIHSTQVTAVALSSSSLSCQNNSLFQSNNNYYPNPNNHIHGVNNNLEEDTQQSCPTNVPAVICDIDNTAVKSSLRSSVVEEEEENIGKQIDELSIRIKRRFALH